MRFSHCMLPDCPLNDSIEMIKAADRTKNIRFGPNVTHVCLREPTLICQQLAT